MTSRNFTIKEEAFEYLESLKTKNKSYSDIILDLKKREESQGLTAFFGLLKDEDMTEVKKNIKKAREDFSKRFS